MQADNCGSSKYRMLTYLAKNDNNECIQCPMKTEERNVNSATICVIALDLEYMFLERRSRGQRN